MAPNALLGSIEFGSVALLELVGDDMIVTANKTADRHAASLRIFTLSFLEGPWEVLVQTWSFSQVGSQTMAPVNWRCETSLRVSTLSLEKNSI